MFRVMQLKARRNRRGFTLIELLVVVLILAVLMAVSIPLYLSAVADSQKKTCRANMQTIANAVQAARVKNNSADYSSFVAAVSTTLEPDLSRFPLARWVALTPSRTVIPATQPRSRSTAPQVRALGPMASSSRA